MNLSASALGVSSVWMKIVRFACVVGLICLASGWAYGCNVGLCLLDDEDSGVARGASLKDLAEAVELVASRAHLFADVDVAVGRVRAFARPRNAGLADMIESMLWL